MRLQRDTLLFDLRDRIRDLKAGSEERVAGKTWSPLTYQ